jgi:hypothetical protein
MTTNDEPTPHEVRNGGLCRQQRELHEHVEWCTLPRKHEGEHRWRPYVNLPLTRELAATHWLDVENGEDALSDAICLSSARLMDVGPSAVANLRDMIDVLLDWRIDKSLFNDDENRMREVARGCERRRFQASILERTEEDDPVRNLLLSTYDNLMQFAYGDES